MTEDCIGCGQCAKLCPRGNIRLEGGKPGFGTDCIQCLSCLQYCPKQAIHMGGATQLLFGIKGGRWDTHPVISKLYNEHWVRPAASETPNSIQRVQGGCYW